MVKFKCYCSALGEVAVSLFVAGAVFGEVQVSFFVAGAVLGEVAVSIFVAGAIFGEVAVSLFVAGAAFAEVQVSFFVVGAVFGELWNTLPLLTLELVRPVWGIITCCLTVQRVAYCRTQETNVEFGWDCFSCQIQRSIWWSWTVTFRGRRSIWWSWIVTFRGRRSIRWNLEW